MAGRIGPHQAVCAPRQRVVAPPLRDGEPRLALLTALLYSRPGGFREHDLMQALAKRRIPPFSKGSGDGLLDLFKRHFILRHLLYRLRDRLLASGEGDLLLDTVGVRLLAHPGHAAGTLVAPEPLRRYYLDTAQLAATDEAAVADLIDGFWRRYRRHEQRHWALGILGLDSDSGPATIRARYRKLAMTTHPDRGGSGSEFTRINAAYAVLVGSRL